MTDGSLLAEAPNKSRPVGRRPAPEPVAPPTAEPEKASRPSERRPVVPTVLDFFPLQEARSTEVHSFFDNLKVGRFTTTRCRKDGQLLWPPRTMCPNCHDAVLEWVDLPMRGRIYAFSAVLAGAPLGMESDVPFNVGLVDLDGVPLRLFGRIQGAPWTSLRIGQPVRVVPG